MSLDKFLVQIKTFEPLSHKGQNGKALIVGGSDLFHAASQWSFKACSRLTDMTFYSSIDENNDLIRDAKFYGTDGVVVRRSELSLYLDEVDAVLIGPGMRRDIVSRFSSEQLEKLSPSDLNENDWSSDTLAVVVSLLKNWPNKRWVIDAGALQVMQPSWTPAEAILTPHVGELRLWSQKLMDDVGWVDRLEAFQNELARLVHLNTSGESLPAGLVESSVFELILSNELKNELLELSSKHGNSVFLLKGSVDIIWNDQEIIVISGGNAGLTKGGTGDVLAGVTLGLRAKSPALASAVIASWLNKQAGHTLYQKQGVMFNSSDLVDEIPVVWRSLTN